MNNEIFEFKATPRTVAPGGCAQLEVVGGDTVTQQFKWSAPEGDVLDENKKALGAKNRHKVYWQAPQVTGPVSITVDVSPKGADLEAGEAVEHTFELEVTSTPVPEVLLQSIEQGFRGVQGAVQLEPYAGERTVDQALWPAIHDGARRVSFDAYTAFIERVLCEDEDIDPETEPTKADLQQRRRRLRNPLHGVDAYQLLKMATEAFLLLNCGVLISDDEGYQPIEEKGRLRNWPEPDVALENVRQFLSNYLGPDGRLPYIDRIINAMLGPSGQRGDTTLRRGQIAASPYCNGVLSPTLDGPCLLELIWSYWHEEGLLVQSLNAISLRFQNKRASEGRDPLAALELDPLRPLANLLWGYIQDEHHRLTISRRAYEYDHHYGMRLVGRAVPKLNPADSRSQFMQAFNTLLNRTAIFYQEGADTTVIPDPFPVLNALKETHLVLAEGAHNQFRDLPWTARVEMLIQQWLLARPEMREFLRGRAMVPYREPWMGQVDTMKKLQGWTDTGITPFNELAVFGEQLVLSIRYGDWVDINDPDVARNWANYWRAEVLSYIHAYRAVTGVDLSLPVAFTDRLDVQIPSVHLSRRAKIRGRA